MVANLFFRPPPLKQVFEKKETPRPPPVCFSKRRLPDRDEPAPFSSSLDPSPFLTCRLQCPPMDDAGQVETIGPSFRLRCFDLRDEASGIFSPERVPFRNRGIFFPKSHDVALFHDIAVDETGYFFLRSPDRNPFQGRAFFSLIRSPLIFSPHPDAQSATS